MIRAVSQAGGFNQVQAGPENGEANTIVAMMAPMADNNSVPVFSRLITVQLP